MTNTLHSINEYDYTGQSDFVAPSHQQASDIVVLVNDVVKTQDTDYTLTGSLVAFTGFTPSNGDKISIRRETASAARQVDFASGSMLKAETLDQDSNQIFNMAQEALDKADRIAGEYNAKYFGSSAVAPTSPSVGDLWFDTSVNIMKVYQAGGWQNATSSVSNATNRVSYTATAAQTTFAMTYDSGHLDVYLNGVKLVASSGSTANDYTATNGTSVVLTTGAAAGDTIELVADAVSPLTSVQTGAAGTDASYSSSTGILTVPRGDTGAAGADGTNGTNGAAGADGADGADGANGTNGTNGTNGADGTGFTGGSYDQTTGVVTFTSDDGLGFLTTDLRGSDATVNATNVANAGAAMLSGATFTGDINLGDSTKINLGASNDLQIYHDGSNSYIDEQGTGDLIVKGLSNILFQRADTGTDMFTIRPNRVQAYDASGNLITKVDANGLSVTGDLDVTGTVNGKDVSTLERVHRCRFSKGSPTLYLHALSPTLAQLGDTYSTKATTGSENNFNLSLELLHQDTLDTNDAYYHVSVDAGSNETVITLGTLASVTTAGAYKQGYVSGDVTKHFSDFMGIARQSGGGSPVNLNGFGWYYNASENRTYMYCYLYQANNFVTGDTLYLHPFDWESAGTTIQSRTYEIDAATYDGAVKSTYNKEHYLGYFKSSVDITVKGGEPSSNTDGNNVVINKISGSIVQVED